MHLHSFLTSQDYTGDAVTAANFLAVLRGEEVRLEAMPDHVMAGTTEAA